MKLVQFFLTENDCYKKRQTIIPKGIMVHSTGCNNPNLKRYIGPDDGKLGKNSYGNHWNVPGLNVCVHAFIGKLKDGSIATYKTLPWNFRGWHGHKGPKGSVNDTHIGFEICEDGLNNKTYFDKVYKEATELCAYLCKMYKLDPLEDGVIICHSEGHARGIASNHADVMHWFPKFGKSMDTFRADVAALLGKKTTSVESPFIVRVSAKNLNIRSGPGTNYSRVGYIPPGAYTIIETADGPGATKWYRLKSKVGWIASDYAKKI